MRVLGVLGDQDPYGDQQQGGALVAGARPDPRPGRSSEPGGADGERPGVLGAEDPFVCRQEGGVLVAGGGRIPGLAR